MLLRCFLVAVPIVAVPTPYEVLERENIYQRVVRVKVVLFEGTEREQQEEVCFFHINDR